MAAARAMTRGIGLWFCVATRADVVRAVLFVVARAVAVRFVADLVVDAVLRDVNVDVRAAVRADFVVLARRCVLFAVPFFARDATPPSRTAAPAPQTHIRADIAKIRTFFISDKNISKFINFRASKIYNLSCEFLPGALMQKLVISFEHEKRKIRSIQ